MDGACPTTSAYYPSSLVDSFHAIPHVDIDLSPSPDNFELSLDYFQVRHNKHTMKLVASSSTHTAYAITKFKMQYKIL